MSNDNQEHVSGYMDRVKVKISEKYKPPPRVILPMSYTQRLIVNKQIQDSIPNYDFSLEKTVREKIHEWKTVRYVMKNEFQQRLNKVKEQEKQFVEEKHEIPKQIAEDEIERNAGQNHVPLIKSCTSAPYNLPKKTTPFNCSSSYPFVSNNSMLMPTQVTKSPSQSNILIPIPLNRSSSNLVCNSFKAMDKSPFNISEFEADTSSPFDNMELKSINDMEELAQVLKTDDLKKQNINNPINFQTNTHNNYTNYNISYNDYCNSFSPQHQQASSSHVQPTSTHLNGFYQSEIPLKPNHNIAFDMQKKHSFTSNNKYGKSSIFDYAIQEANTTQTCKSVPDIMRTLQTELDNSKYANTNSGLTLSDNKLNVNFTKMKINNEEDDEQFLSLSKDLQQLTKSISLMGFPLSRVIRVCKIIGNDQKKIVEHLLAMSDLLDLGFTESSVTNALIQCDNDRDKALDVLIS